MIVFLFFKNLIKSSTIESSYIGIDCCGFDLKWIKKNIKMSLPFCGWLSEVNLDHRSRDQRIGIDQRRDE